MLVCARKGYIIIILRLYVCGERLKLKERNLQAKVSCIVYTYAKNRMEKKKEKTNILIAALSFFHHRKNKNCVQFARVPGAIPTEMYNKLSFPQEYFFLHAKNGEKIEKDSE